MPVAPLFAWEGREYEHNPKSADWYWALGIITVACAIASILFSNYLFAIVVIVAAAAIGLHAAKEPPLHNMLITERGLTIGHDLYPFEKMESFSVLEDIEGQYPPVLSIKNDSWLTPHLTVPLDGVDADLVYAYLLTRIDEGDHKHTFTGLVAAWLGF